jgi:hypothetical protein
MYKNTAAMHCRSKHRWLEVLDWHRSTGQQPACNGILARALCTRTPRSLSQEARALVLLILLAAELLSTDTQPIGAQDEARASIATRLHRSATPVMARSNASAYTTSLGTGLPVRARPGPYKGFKCKAHSQSAHGPATSTPPCLQQRTVRGLTVPALAADDLHACMHNSARVQVSIAHRGVSRAQPPTSLPRHTPTRMQACSQPHTASHSQSPTGRHPAHAVAPPSSPHAARAATPVDSSAGPAFTHNASTTANQHHLGSEPRSPERPAQQAAPAAAWLRAQRLGST